MTDIKTDIKTDSNRDIKTDIKTGKQTDCKAGETEAETVGMKDSVIIILRSSSERSWESDSREVGMARREDLVFSGRLDGWLLALGLDTVPTACLLPTS